MACEQLSPLIQRAREVAASRAERLLQPSERFERILLMPRQGGKSTIGRVAPFANDGPLSMTGGWLDEGQQTRAELTRTIMGMLRIHREQRYEFPKYNPKITLRPETWDAIKGRFYWMGEHEVAHLAFPREAFYDALTEAGATPDALLQFGPTWLRTFNDIAGRLYPGLAFDALQRICEKAKTIEAKQTCKWQGAAEACAAFVQAQGDVCYWLTYMVPDDRATITGGKFGLPEERFVRRIRQAQRHDPTRKLPFKMTAPQFIRWGNVAGIWARTSGIPSYAIALPYSIGASYLKARLTDAAFSHMSKE